MALLCQIRRARQSKDTLHYVELYIRAHCSFSRMAATWQTDFYGCFLAVKSKR
jgi:hypothetical protein